MVHCSNAHSDCQNHTCERAELSCCSFTDVPEQLPWSPGWRWMVNVVGNVCGVCECVCYLLNHQPDLLCLMHLLSVSFRWSNVLNLMPGKIRFSSAGGAMRFLTRAFPAFPEYSPRCNWYSSCAEQKRVALKKLYSWMWSTFSDSGLESARYPPKRISFFPLTSNVS